MKKINLKWQAHGLIDSVAAISGSVITPTSFQKVVLPANQSLSIEVQPGVPVVFQGQLPSGEVIQKTVQFTDNQEESEVVLGENNSANDPDFPLHSYLGSFKKSRPDPKWDFAVGNNEDPLDILLQDTDLKKKKRLETNARA